MNSVAASSGSRFVAVLLFLPWAVWRVTKISLFTVLAIFAPLVRWFLASAVICLVLTTALFFFFGPHGLKVSYGVLLGLAAGCAIALAAYEALLGALSA